MARTAGQGAEDGASSQALKSSFEKQGSLEPGGKEWQIKSVTDYTINLRNQSEQSNIFPITFPSTTKQLAKIYFVDTQKWIARCQMLPKQIDTTPLQRCLPNAVPSETQRASRKRSLAMFTEEDEPKRSAAYRCRSRRIWQETRGQDRHRPSTLGGWWAGA